LALKVKNQKMLGKLKKRKRLRVHGFLKRSSTVWGKKVLQARRRKGRHQLTVSYPKRFQEINGKAKLHIIAWGTAKKSPFDGKGNYIA
jgi:large subunit ribosomal protein L34